MIKSTIFRVCKRLTQVVQRMSTPGYSFISTIDLMQPVNGVITAAHLTIISRMLDVQRIRKGGDSYRDWAFNKYWRSLNGEELTIVKEQCNRQTKQLIDSLDKYGWDFNVSSVHVHRKPFAIYDGTHRCGYCLNHNPFQMIRIIVDKIGWVWSFEDGVEYFLKCNMPQKKVDFLVSNYYQLIEKYKYDYVVLFRKKDCVNMGIVKQLGTVSSLNHYLVAQVKSAPWLNRKNQNFVKKLKLGEELEVVRFWTTIKNLYFYQHRVGCIIFDRVFNDTFCMYSSTITESIEIDIWIKDCLTLI